MEQLGAGRRLLLRQCCPCCPQQPGSSVLMATWSTSMFRKSNSSHVREASRSGKSPVTLLSSTTPLTALVRLSSSSMLGSSMSCRLLYFTLVRWPVAARAAAHLKELLEDIVAGRRLLLRQSCPHCPQQPGPLRGQGKLHHLQAALPCGAVQSCPPDPHPSPRC